MCGHARRAEEHWAPASAGATRGNRKPCGSSPTTGKRPAHGLQLQLPGQSDAPAVGGPDAPRTSVAIGPWCAGRKLAPKAPLASGRWRERPVATSPTASSPGARCAATSPLATSPSSRKRACRGLPSGGRGARVAGRPGAAALSWKCASARRGYGTTSAAIVPPFFRCLLRRKQQSGSRAPRRAQEQLPDGKGRRQNRSGGRDSAPENLRGNALRRSRSCASRPARRSPPCRPRACRSGPAPPATSPRSSPA